MAPVEPVYQRRDGERGWLVHEQVDVVDLAVEFGHLDVEVSADGVRGVFAEGEQTVGAHRWPLLGRGYQMRMQQGHAVPGAAIGVGCQCGPLRCGCGDV